MLLSSSDGRGILFAGESLLNINVQDYSLEALNESKQTHQLERGENIYLHLDYKQMGLGGDDSWNPRVHPEYLLIEKQYKYAFRMKPVDSNGNIPENPRK
jgi:beta-galactosidase